MYDFYIKQGDTRPNVQYDLLDSDSNPVDLTGASVQFHLMNEADVVVVNAAASVITPLAGTVRYTWQVGDTDTAGLHYFEFAVTYADSSVETFPNSGNFQLLITPSIA